MPTVIAANSQQYNAGTRVLTANNSEPYTIVTMTFTRENWPLTQDDVLLTVDLERSTDNGQTWQYVGGASFNGGVIYTDAAQTIPMAECSAQFWQSDGVTEQNIPMTGRIRGTFTNTERFRTALTIDAT